MSGKIYEETTADGMKYSIYIPDNCSPGAPILSYNFSVGMKDNNDNYVWRKAKEAVLNQGYDTVVIFPNHYDPSTWNKAYQNNTIVMLDDAKEKYGLTSKQLMTIGFSSSCSQSVKTTAEYIIQNPGVERQVAFTQDGFIWKSGVLSDEEIDALIENDTLIVSYCQPQNWNKLSSAVQENLDMLIITDKSEHIDPDKSYWGRHDEIALDFFEDGLYNDVIRFLDGRGNLDTSRYNFYTTDDNGNLVEVSEPNAFYELLGIDSYVLRVKRLASLKDYMISSGEAELASYMNDIINKIRNTSFLKTTFATFNGFSDSNVPMQISDCVAEYFNQVSKLLDKIANGTSFTSEVHVTYTEVDEKLQAMM